mmetsp:Transcript_20972/g.41116  ORF Transcript_20972/g.41116 Transcript_20972/m.41116 type:complete len:162 (-) Transcript_20972:526-1011(-)|eukprot:CAMPEP_0171496894 /NCGR_PEP_ID=MMETSP0958-20121227/6959_1 /TAXON_ID=87120 /ORGANISM="Aurantiochytrium limacinum, Strain ATCCMYA-1381" /LENGTH=161 /DNA_ID=CAMNT_0012031055 /DNA_START=395 /DNA_END=880 /DNA_ORIENTATION=-
MTVTFADRAEVFVFEDERDHDWRKTSVDYNLEYKRETKLYGLVLAWKQAQQNVAPCEKIKTKSLKSLIGRDYAKKAHAAFGAKTVEGLQAALIEIVLCKWPLLEMRSTRFDYDLSSVIVLSLVAETLYDRLGFKLAKPEDRNRFFSLAFHVSQGILQLRYP